MPHMAVVDVDRPDATSLMQLFRTVSTNVPSETPVLGLTRSRDVRARLRAFTLGVDDVMSVPFAPKELLARSVVITRRLVITDRPMNAVIRVGGMEIDIGGREVRAGDVVVRLTSTEQRMLSAFASRPAEVVSRDEIIEAVWGFGFTCESNIVDRHIHSLRVKLGDDSRKPQLIATVHGKGYRFLPGLAGQVRRTRRTQPVWTARARERVYPQ